jgi:hypothetical protein
VADGSVRPHVMVTPLVEMSWPRSVTNSFSEEYLLEANAVVKDAVLVAGSELNVPEKPDADDSMVAMNCVGSPAVDRNVAAGSDMYP